MRFFLLSLCVLGCARAAFASTAQQPTSRSGPRNVAIVVFPGVELLDFAGPLQVFASAHADDMRAFHTYTVAESREPLKSMNVVAMTPEFTLDDCPPPDVILVPGGDVPDGSVKLRDWLRARSPKTEVMMSVCNGALVYANAGLLQGLEATTHKSAMQSLALMDPSVKVVTNRRYVDTGHVVTTAGISAGIDGALHLVARFYGDDAAWKAARYMEYDWRPDEIAKLHAEPARLVEGIDAMRLITQTQKTGLDAALAEYKKMEKRPSEDEMNRWGYTLLRAKRVDDAISLLRFVDAAFPASSNASDSLSEALESNGDREGAKTAAEICLARLEKETSLSSTRRQLVHNASSSRIARLSGAPASSFRYSCPPCGAGDCDAHGYLESGRCPGCAMELVERGG
jgi:transcriptional regulator GlxA family with amidase domain